MTFVAGQTKLPKRGSMGCRRQAACVLFVVSSCLDHTKGFAVSTGTVAWQSAFGFTRSTHVRRCSRLESIATPTTGVDASDGSGTSATSYSPSELIEALRDASAQSRPLGVERIFSVLSEHRGFMNEMWQRLPFYCDVPLPSLADQFTMKEIQEAVDADFVEAGRGTFKAGSSGWMMAQVSQPRGKSFEDAKLRFEDVKRALKEKSGTVVVNSAGAYIRPLAAVCLDVVQAWEMPVCLNLYVTAAGQQTSAPPHTDKQDVFVMQTQGRKRWRVFAPPPPSRKPNSDPLARGKGADVLSIQELVGEGCADVLLDVVLEPGQLLYVPAGFPHTTDTVTSMPEDNKEPSVHLTIGIDTHIWGLNYATLRQFVLRRSGVPDPIQSPLEKSLSESNYWKLYTSLPLGFLGESVVAGMTRWSEMKQAQVEAMTSTAARIERELQPGRWEDSVPDDEVLGQGEAGVVAQRLLDHHAKLTSIFREMYGDVTHGLTVVPRDSSFLRSRPYLDLIERTMAQLLQWGLPGAPPASAPAPAVAEAAPAKTGGFGGVASGTAAKKGGAGSSKKKSKRK